MLNVSDDPVPDTKKLAASLCPTDSDSVTPQGWGVRENDLVALIERHSQDALSGGKQSDRCKSKVSSSAQRQTRLSAGQRAELVELYCSGVSVVRLAEKFSIHKGTVSAHLERAGVPRRGWQRKMTDKQVEEASRLYVRARWSLARLGKHYSVSASTVRTELMRFGVQTGSDL